MCNLCQGLHAKSTQSMLMSNLGALHCGVGSVMAIPHLMVEQCKPQITEICFAMLLHNRGVMFAILHSSDVAEILT